MAKEGECRRSCSMSFSEEEEKTEEAFEDEDWLCAMCIFILSDFFCGLEAWSESLRKWRVPSAKLETARGLHVGMSALAAAVSNAIDEDIADQHDSQTIILQKLVQVRESENHDHHQLIYLKKATDAVNDLKNGRHKKGHPKNVGLLEKAYTNAEDAARFPSSDLYVKLQAYRLWIVTAYWHEVTTKSSTDAKAEAMFILGHVIFQDTDLLRVCEKFATPGQAGDTWFWHKSTNCKLAAEDWTASTVIEFLLEVVSSVTMLSPLDADVGRANIVKVVGAGMKMVNERLELIGGELLLGAGAPRSIVLAMGRYCTMNHCAAKTYPNISFLAMTAWEQDKERLAMDNFFVGMGGEHWTENGGWIDKNGDLCKRFGITVEDGHVTKICLADNNLRGHLYDDLADCEHLRELVLHGNEIMGGIPPRMECLINHKPNMVVTGLTQKEAPRNSLDDPVNGEPLRQESSRHGSSRHGSSRHGSLHQTPSRHEPKHHDPSRLDALYHRSSRHGSSCNRSRPRRAVRTPSLEPPSFKSPHLSHGGMSEETYLSTFPGIYAGQSKNLGSSIDSTPTGTISTGTENTSNLEGFDKEKTSEDTTPLEETSQKKKKSMWKKAAKFLKEAAGADFATGYAIKCQTCKAKLDYNGKAPTCPNNCQST